MTGVDPSPPAARPRVLLDTARQSEQILGSMSFKAVIGLSVAPWVLCGLCVFSVDMANARAGAPDAPQETAKPRVVITTLTMHGVTRADRRTLTKSLLGGFSGTGLQVVPRTRAQKTLAGRASLLGCETSVCLKVAHQIEHCAPCTTAEAAEKLSRAAKATGLKARATLRATPTRRITRRTPPRRRQSSPNGGSGLPHKGADTTARAFTIAGITLLSAGAALVGSGATLWVLDGQTARSTPSYVDVYRTRTGGIITTSIGLATTLTGAALLIYGLIRGRQRRPSVTVGFDPRRRTLLVRGSF